MSDSSYLESRPYQLLNGVQHYAWGSKGQDALIPDLLGIPVEEDLAYAELWIGTHPRAPSQVLLDSGPAPLSSVISKYRLQMLGARVAQRFAGALPFLLKILSVAQPLSIQAHPNREQARMLHARDPEHYPDDNHKPEIAIALDSLTALVGLRHPADLLNTLDRHWELAQFIGLHACARLRQTQEGTTAAQGDAMRLVHSSLIQRATTSPEDLADCIERLEDRLCGSGGPLLEDDRLFLELRKRGGRADVGHLSVFLLDVVHLEEGEGIYIAPGTLHAYVSGNIVECMASSDNVVRAGLTSKFQDFRTILDVVSYETNPTTILGRKAAAGRITYPTPADEFEVSRWRLGPNETVREAPSEGPGVFLVTQGDILVTWRRHEIMVEARYHRGQSFFVPASMQEWRMTSLRSAELFRAEVPLR